jgi:hypothetical protein
MEPDIFKIAPTFIIKIKAKSPGSDMQENTTLFCEARQ